MAPRMGPALFAVALSLSLLAASEATALNPPTTLALKPTRVTHPNTPGATFRDASAAGRRVFFETAQRLTSDDNDSGRVDVYERSAGGTRLVSKAVGVTDPDTDDASFGGASRDGRRVFFLTTQRMTGDDGDSSRTDVYQRASGVTTLMSKPTGPADPDTSGAFVNGVSADGSRVFIVTRQKLTDGDDDTSREDIYERSAGTTKLVSAPTGVNDPDSGDPTFQGVSQDGTRVFFTTIERLN